MTKALFFFSFEQKNNILRFLYVKVVLFALVLHKQFYLCGRNIYRKINYLNLKKKTLIDFELMNNVFVTSVLTKKSIRHKICY